MKPGRTYHLYSKCWGGNNKYYLSRDYSGTRYMCEKLKSKHYQVVSVLEKDAAEKRYLPC
jgi:hypothetical protein